jgi:hypothetical protein
MASAWANGKKLVAMRVLNALLMIRLFRLKIESNSNYSDFLHFKKAYWLE